MEFDFESHLSAVHRSVAFLQRDGKPASAVTLSRAFAATLEDVWDAVTNSDRIPRWFAPVSGDLELGGHYQVEGNAGGTITACERLSLFDADVGVRRRRQLGGSAIVRRCRRTPPPHPHAHRIPFGTLGGVWSGRGRRRLGVGSLGARPAYNASCRAKARRRGLCRLTRGQGVHHRQQRGVGASRNRGGNGPRQPREPRQRARQRSTRENQPRVNHPRLPDAPANSQRPPTRAAPRRRRPAPPP